MATGCTTAAGLRGPHALCPHIAITDRQTEGQTSQLGYILRLLPFQAADSKENKALKFVTVLLTGIGFRISIFYIYTPCKSKKQDTLLVLKMASRWINAEC